MRVQGGKGWTQSPGIWWAGWGICPPPPQARASQSVQTTWGHGNGSDAGVRIHALFCNLFCNQLATWPWASHFTSHVQNQWGKLSAHNSPLNFSYSCQSPSNNEINVPWWERRKLVSPWRLQFAKYCAGVFMTRGWPHCPHLTDEISKS